MFTGLVDDVGTIERATPGLDGVGLELRVRCRYDDLVAGESVAVNGVCLTVRDRGGRGGGGVGGGGADGGGGAMGEGAGYFTAAAMLTTVAVTTVGDWRPGRRVNLERALRAGDRLGGHFVQGHVDGVARVARAESVRDALLVDLAVPPELSDLVVPRGSIAVDGVSLTIAALVAPDVVQVSLIEYTRGHTTLGSLRAGDMVNVEADVLAKHVKRLLAPHGAGEPWRSAGDQARGER